MVFDMSCIINIPNPILLRKCEQFTKVESWTWVVISLLLREITRDKPPNCAVFTGEMQEYHYWIIFKMAPANSLNGIVISFKDNQLLRWLADSSIKGLYFSWKFSSKHPHVLESSQLYKVGQFLLISQLWNILIFN